MHTINKKIIVLNIRLHFCQQNLQNVIHRMFKIPYQSVFNPLEGFLRLSANICILWLLTVTLSRVQGTEHLVRFGFCCSKPPPWPHLQSTQSLCMCLARTSENLFSWQLKNIHQSWTNNVQTELRYRGGRASVKTNSSIICLSYSGLAQIIYSVAVLTSPHFIQTHLLFRSWEWHMLFSDPGNGSV